MPRRFPALAPLVALAACGTGGGDGSAARAPGDPGSHQPYRGIAEEERLQFTGTEPFWGGEVHGGTLTYSTPEKLDGTKIAVDRFAGRNGIAFSGTLDGQPFDMAVTPGDCSDGMSDRTYPFTVTLKVLGEVRKGCAWSAAHPFAGPRRP